MSPTPSLFQTSGRRLLPLLGLLTGLSSVAVLGADPSPAAGHAPGQGHGGPGHGKAKGGGCGCGMKGKAGPAGEGGGCGCGMRGQAGGGGGACACDPKAADAGACACGMHGGAATTTLTDDMLASFAALPARLDDPANPATEARIALGRMLYFEKRLSKNHDLSCNSCHDLARFGVDNQRFSTGHKKQLGGRNSPTVYNAGNHIAQFWDGRAKDMEEQAKGPIMNPVEMAMPDEGRVVKTLTSMPEYVEKFQQAFPGEADPVTMKNVGRAIGAFERGLVTPSRFDKFLAGDKGALSAAEQEGLASFVSLGCTTCHNGAAVGGTSFQKLGLVVEYPGLKDEGRFAVTKDEADKAKFRVPSLRNVAKTGPYFHDGSLAQLHQVIRTMAKHQLGKDLKGPEIHRISAFLQSLTGELPKDYIRPPALPKSTPQTPKPDPS